MLENALASRAKAHTHSLTYTRSAEDTNSIYVYNTWNEIMCAVN